MKGRNSQSSLHLERLSVCLAGAQHAYGGAPGKRREVCWEKAVEGPGCRGVWGRGQSLSYSPWPCALHVVKVQQMLCEVKKGFSCQAERVWGHFLGCHLGYPSLDLGPTLLLSLASYGSQSDLPKI